MIKSAKWLDKNIHDLHGENYLVTGSTSGIGLMSALSLLYKGAHVTFASRNREKAAQAVKLIAEALPTASFDFVFYDQADERSIHALVASLSCAHYDGIILNAGVYLPKRGAKAMDGTPLTFFTNAVGTYLLFQLLQTRYPSARFVFVNSIANSAPVRNDFAGYMSHRRHERHREYTISKRAIMYEFGWAFRHTKLDLRMAHPGVSATGIIRGYPHWFGKTAEVCLNLVVHKPWKACLGEVLAACEPLYRGAYLTPSGPFHISGYPKLARLNKKRTYSGSDQLINYLAARYPL